MNRVSGAILDGTATLNVIYDEAGNIRYKSDVGSYSYANASRRHLTTSAGAETFTYDANGNLASRGGLAQQWASFNLPTIVRKAGYQAQFAYGPDHERWRQVASYSNGTETTHYVGGLLEKESTHLDGLYLLAPLRANAGRLDGRHLTQLRRQDAHDVRASGPSRQQ